MVTAPDGSGSSDAFLMGHEVAMGRATPNVLSTFYETVHRIASMFRLKYG
jgi:hypothetical protein